MKYIYRLVSSTNDSLSEYEYHVPTIKTVKQLIKGEQITLFNPRTRQTKRFSIDYIKGNTNQLKLRNSNITIVLKRSISNKET